MKSFNRLMARLAEPDRFMDLFVRNRWDTVENPAAGNVDDRYYFDRSGALKINSENEDVRRAFIHNVKALSSKNTSQE